MGERVVRLEEWTEGHEKRCEERQTTMGREIRELKIGVGGLTKGAWAVVLALLGWALVQIYSNIEHREAPHVSEAAAPR